MLNVVVLDVGSVPSISKSRKGALPVAKSGHAFPEKLSFDVDFGAGQSDGDMLRPRNASEDEYASLEQSIIAVSAADAVDRPRVAERCYANVLALEADRALTREQRDELLTLLQSVVETSDGES